MQCANCDGRDSGEIGQNQYDYWNYFMEMKIPNHNITIQQLDNDGSLHSLNNVCTYHERRIQ